MTDRRKLARRKERLAQVREQEANVLLSLADRAVREKEQEIEQAILIHQQSEEDFFAQQGAAAGAWMEVLQRSRERHAEQLETLETELGKLKVDAEEKRKKHRQTLESLRSSEKVTEKVVNTWKKEQLGKEARELDEVAGNQARNRED